MNFTLRPNRCVVGGWYFRLVQKTGLGNSIYRIRPRPISVNVSLGQRTLLTKSVLGLDGFVHRRKKYAYNFQSKEEAFRKHLERVIANKDLSIYIDDLKSVIYLCQKDESDFMQLTLLFERFMKYKNNQLVEFNFGPEVMRLFHMLEEPLEGLKLMKNENLKEFFYQLTTYSVLMDSLFLGGYYEEIVWLYHHLIERNICYIAVPRDPSLLMVAACYKLNNEDSLKESIEIINKALKSGVKLSSIHLCFVATLALKLDHSTDALEILSRVKSNSDLFLNLKAMALAKEKQIENAVDVVKQLTRENKFRKLSPILQETIDAIEDALKGELVSSGNNNNFKMLRKELEESKLISHQSLDTLLCKPLDDGKDSLFNKMDNRLEERSIQRQRLMASFNQIKKKS